MVGNLRALALYVTAVLSIGSLAFLPWVLSSYGLFPAETVGIFILFGGLSPTLAAVVASYFQSGRDGVRRLFSTALRADMTKTSLGLALLLPFIIFYGAIALLYLTGGSYDFLRTDLLLFLPMLIGNIFMNLWEEVGWRGFAVPELQRRYNALVSGLIVGVIWSLWHWPHFAMSDSQMAVVYGSYPLFIISTVVVSLIYTSIYNWSRGNVVVTTLFHAGFNTVGGLLFLATGTPVPILFLLAAEAITAAILIVAFGPDSLSREERVRGVAG